MVCLDDKFLAVANVQADFLKNGEVIWNVGSPGVTGNRPMAAAT
jgi:hypothetical protein